MDLKQYKISEWDFLETYWTCPQHGNQKITLRKHHASEKWSEGYCPICESEKAALEAKKDEERQSKEQKAVAENRVRDLLGISLIPPRFQSKNFDNYEPENERAGKIKALCFDYAEKFDEKLKTGSSIIFCGNAGTGKSHLACAIANYIISNRSKSALFVKVIKAIRSVKETYSGGSEQNAINAFTQPDLLILDEVGVQFGSDTEKQILFEIINERYENFKPTILISNLTAADLAQFVGDRILDRMKENGGLLLKCDWESHRSK